MLSNKKRNLIVTELFIRDKKLSISLIFITQSYYAVLKNIRLNSTQYLIMKIASKSRASTNNNQSADIDFKDFMKLYKKFIKTFVFSQ